MNFDFYSLCAHYWGVDRDEAASRFIIWYYSKVRWDMGDCIPHASGQSLDFVPREVRAETLAYQGIILGDS